METFESWKPHYEKEIAGMTTRIGALEQKFDDLDTEHGATHATATFTKGALDELRAKLEEIDNYIRGPKPPKTIGDHIRDWAAVTVIVVGAIFWFAKGPSQEDLVKIQASVVKMESAAKADTDGLRASVGSITASQARIEERVSTIKDAIQDIRAEARQNRSKP